MEKKEKERKILEALTFARKCHKHQKRKVSGADYIEHPILVSEILQEVGGREEIIIASLLHDVLEDTSGTKEEIQEQFGEEVLTLVEECTDEIYGNPTTKENWEERKAEAVKKARKISLDGLLIKVADKIANNQSLKEDLEKYGREETWQHFNANKEQKRRHQGAMMQVFVERLGKEHSLVRRAQEIYEEIFEK